MILKSSKVPFLYLETLVYLQCHESKSDVKNNMLSLLYSYLTFSFNLLGVDSWSLLVIFLVPSNYIYSYLVIPLPSSGEPVIVYASYTP